MNGALLFDITDSDLTPGGFGFRGISTQLDTRYDKFQFPSR